MAKTTASRFLSPSPPASASSFPTPLPPATDPRQLYHSCACSSLSTEQSCTDGRSLPKRVSSEVAVSFKSRIKALRSLSAPNPSRFQVCFSRFEVFPMVFCPVDLRFFPKIFSVDLRGFFSVDYHTPTYQLGIVCKLSLPCKV